MDRGERKMKRGEDRPGFTLVEVMIACGLLSLLLLGVFGVFRGGAGGFNTGQWTIQTQKKAQLFLVQLRELLEKANNAESYFSNGVPTVNTLPLYAKTGFLNTVTALTGNTGLMYFSVTTAYNSANPLIGAPETRGVWAGVSLVAAAKGDGTGYKLILTRSGTDADHIRCGPPYALALAGGNFNAEPSSKRVSIELEDVQSIGFNTTNAGTIEITIVLSRDFGGGRVSTFREFVRAKLMNADMRVTGHSF